MFRAKTYVYYYCGCHVSVRANDSLFPFLSSLFGMGEVNE